MTFWKIQNASIAWTAGSYVNVDAIVAVYPSWQGGTDWYVRADIDTASNWVELTGPHSSQAEALEVIDVLTQGFDPT